MKPILPTLAAAALIAAAPTAHAIEEPAYTLVQAFDRFELRRYAPYLVAEVTVAGPQDEAGDRGFRILAAYIFGDNEGQRKVAMTAPVTQAAAPKMIEMTAPVMQSEADGGFVVRFMMPGAFTLETLPEPTDARIRLARVPQAMFAVVRYSGSWSAANYDAHLATLRQGVEAEGISTVGDPVWARYDAPWMPWFLRRNEIWLRVE
jgi:hypothetical protein